MGREKTTVSNHESIIQALRASLASADDPVAIRKHIANLLVQDARYAEAEVELKTLLMTHPNDLDVIKPLATCYHARGAWKLLLLLLDDISLADQPTLQDLLADANRVLELRSTGTPTPPMPPASSPEPDEHLVVENWPKRHPAGQPALPDVLERPKLTFADVGGMDDLKASIHMKIIQPTEHPELYTAYGQKIGGGILMYGPPGCGKTYLARATAGQVSAFFLSIGIHDVLSMYVGRSEENLHELFQTARRNAPCVVFIDEIDALGADRLDQRQSSARNVINQLLVELDGIDQTNDGILILAATNAPWHVDPALRRPGRFGDTIFVPPPDAIARAAIFDILLRDKPVDAIDTAQLAAQTGGLSGADIKAVVNKATESKLAQALQQGKPLPLTMPDLLKTAAQVRPSTQEWFATAKNYAVYANESGTYDDILAYMNQQRQAGNGFFSRFRLGGGRS